jgi:hypothetical protein
VYLLKASVMGVFVGGLLAGPALAVDCFPKVRAAEAYSSGPQGAAKPGRKPAVARARLKAPHAPGVGRAKIVKASARALAPAAGEIAESSFTRRTRATPFVRPVECDTQPTVAISTPLPADAVSPAQRLLDEIAGPPTLEGGTSPRETYAGEPLGVLPGGGGGGGVFPFDRNPPIGPPLIPPLTTAVPEPATWAMLILGFFGVGVGLRSRRARAALISR